MVEENEVPTGDAAQPPSPPEPPAEGGDGDGPTHPLQKLMDNPWLLLVLGLVVPGLSYTVWGWIELLLVQPAKLP